MRSEGRIVVRVGSAGLIMTLQCVDSLKPKGDDRQGIGLARSSRESVETRTPVRIMCYSPLPPKTA